MNYSIPDPADFASSDLRAMSVESWRGLALVAAGLPTVFLCSTMMRDYVAVDAELAFVLKTLVPDAESRARAAGVIEKAITMWEAESKDEMRARIPSSEWGKVVPNLTTEEFMVRVEAGVRGVIAAGFDLDAAESEHGPEARRAAKELLGCPAQARGHVEVAEAIILAWHVLRCYRTDPDYAFTEEDWKRLDEGLRSDRRGK